MKPIRVMVTGAGSMVGQGIMKSLHHSQLPVTLIAADISPYHAGLYRADEAVLIPQVEKETDVTKIVKILKENAVDILMIGSEFDLSYFANNKHLIEKEVNTLVVAAEPETVKMANDKWLTVEFLKEHHLPHPVTYRVDSLEDALEAAKHLGYPFILKGRQGTSARNVHIIKSENDLPYYCHMTKNAIAQEMLSPPSGTLDAEYTCSIFKTKENVILGPFNSRRVLKHGSSWLTEVKPYEFLNDLMLGIGRVLPFMGSINVQLMNTAKGPIPFEINARFSGTTAIRSYYGFNEPAMVIKNFYLGEPLSNPRIQSGYCLRYVEETFLSDEDISEKLTSDKITLKNENKNHSFLTDNELLPLKSEKLGWF